MHILCNVLAWNVICVLVFYREGALPPQGRVFGVQRKDQILFRLPLLIEHLRIFPHIGCISAQGAHCTASE